MYFLEVTIPGCSLVFVGRGVFLQKFTTSFLAFLDLP